MNSRKDYLLLALSSLLLLGACLFAAAKTGFIEVGFIRQLALSDSGTQIALPEIKEVPKGIVYPSSPRPSVDLNVPDWLSPEENEDNWDYDFFTTIDILWDPALKEYVPKGRKVMPLPPFGVALSKVGHPVYPYVLRSTFPGRKGREEEDRQFVIENVETKKYFTGCKIGKPLDDKTPVIPVSFSTVQDKTKTGMAITRQVLKVDDKSIGRIVEIDNIRPVEFLDRLDIVLVSTSEPDKSWTFHKAGETFSYNEAKFTVKGVDLSSKTVTVDKVFAPNPKKPPKTFTEVLSVPAAAASSPKPGAPAAAPSAAPKPPIVPGLPFSLPPPQ